MWDFAVIAGATFQSTPPSREAARPQFHHFFRARISIHASLAGGDRLPITYRNPRRLFQSTPPSREATCTSR